MKIKEIIKIILFIIVGLTISEFQSILAYGDENGQEYTFYNAVKENATNYVEMGVITPEPIDNILKVEKRIKPNNDGSYSFSIPESIYKAKNNTGLDLIIDVETLKDISQLADFRPEGDVYIAENIWIEPDSAVYIDFKVKNSWLKDNGEDIQLLKWTGNQWKKLGHRIINKDDSYTYFEEGIAGSSILTIVGTSIQNQKKNEKNENMEEPKNSMIGNVINESEGIGILPVSAREQMNKSEFPFTINGIVTFLMIIILIGFIVQNEIKRRK